MRKWENFPSLPRGFWDKWLQLELRLCHAFWKELPCFLKKLSEFVRKFEGAENVFCLQFSEIHTFTPWFTLSQMAPYIRCIKASIKTLIINIHAFIVAKSDSNDFDFFFHPNFDSIFYLCFISFPSNFHVNFIPTPFQFLSNFFPTPFYFPSIFLPILLDTMVSNLETDLTWIQKSSLRHEICLKKPWPLHLPSARITKKYLDK